MSSTIDAAIINTISDIKAQSGGAILTEGAAINIISGKINVKYNTDTMELVNGALSAKTTSSGGGGGGGSSGSSLVAGSAIDISGNRINVQYDTSTLGINANNFLYVKSGGGGLTEDVVSKLPGGMRSSSTYIEQTGIDRRYVDTGLILRMERKSTGNIESFVLVVYDDITESDNDDIQAKFVPLTYTSDTIFDNLLNVQIHKTDGLETYTIHIELTSSEWYFSETSQLGLMRVEQMCPATSARISQFTYNRNKKLRDYMKYLLKTVETLKQKAGI